MWQILDIAFFVMHAAIMLVNVFGSLLRYTQRLQLVLLSLTTLSWVALAPWYGLGFCFCTEWHWLVREKLGDSDLPLSYIVWIFDVVFGVSISTFYGDVIAVSGLVFGWIGALSVLYFKLRRK